MLVEYYNYANINLKKTLKPPLPQLTHSPGIAVNSLVDYLSGS